MHKKSIKIKDLSPFYRKALKKVLTGHNDNEDNKKIEICFNDNISLRRMSSLWYGGNIVDIACQGYTFHIEAVGDVLAYLWKSNSDNLAAYVKDKNNSGKFGEEIMNSY